MREYSPVQAAPIAAGVPTMRFLIDEIAETDVGQGKHIPRYRPLTWCSNLFQAANVFRGLRAATAPDEPFGDWSRPVRIVELDDNGKEIGEVPPERYEDPFFDVDEFDEPDNPREAVKAVSFGDGPTARLIDAVLPGAAARQTA